MDIEVRRLGPGDEEAVRAARTLFDAPPQPEATQRFLAEPANHLLVGYDEAGVPVGFVSGVELTHPDKGTEMFLYELGVDESSRGRGVGRTLVEALAAVGREAGCYDMWVLADADNAAAQATYARASHASVSVDRQNGHAVIEVRDDGVGGADPAHGSGLSGLADRVAALDGTLSLESPVGGGTHLHAEIPCG